MYFIGVYYNMKIIETPIFTRRLKEIMTDEDYHKLQIELINHPEMGKIIPGSGGLRKLRWVGSRRGKRGGSRIIYYWFSQEELILLLFIYTKKEQDDLTHEQLKILKTMIKEELR